MSEFLLNWKLLHEEPKQTHSFDEFLKVLPNALYDIYGLTNLYNMYCGAKQTPEEFMKSDNFQKHFKENYSIKDAIFYEKID